MESSYSILGLLLLTVCLVKGENINCTAVQENPQDFPLSYVNQCLHDASLPVAQPRAHRFMYCPPFECKNQCIMGWKKDKYGCTTCECAEEGKEGMFEGDIEVVGDMRIYMNANLEGGPGPGKQVRGATRRLPLWQMYKSGNNYVVPYVIASSIGMKSATFTTRATGKLS